MSYAVLAVVSDCYPPLWGRLPTCYSPVRHSPWPSASTQSRFVRLACIRHAASVRPEPGSNSHEKFHKSTWLISLLACFLPSLSAAELLVVHQVSSMTLTFLVCLCLVFNVLVVTTWQLLYISTSLTSCQQLFRSFFWSFWSVLVAGSNSYIISVSAILVKHFLALFGTF